MIAYLVKEILCSTVLLLVYMLLLQKEKMHRFNRFYLLLSIVFSFIVPMITIKMHSLILPEDAGYLNAGVPVNINAASVTITPDNNNLIPFVIVFYLVITSVLLFRFVKNMHVLILRIERSNVIPYKGAKLILTEDKLTPHCFWNCILINKEDFENGRIEKEVLCHELTHIRQRHTLDILFIEFLRSILWFNPALIFYRKSIQLNHEFLADDAVVSVFGNANDYQRLLIDKISHQAILPLANRFNYLIIKKRLIMITKNKSRRSAACRQLAVAPLLIGVVLLFGNKIMAQNTTSTQKEERTAIEQAGKGVSGELMDEYNSIVKRNMQLNGKKFLGKVSAADEARLQTIYKLMSKRQQSQVTVIFIPASSPLPAVKPAESQLKSWEDGAIYGVWIDGKRVSNALLSNYQPADFNQVYVSKLEKNATNYGKHYYQVDLMTNEYYNDYYQKALQNKGKLMMVRRFYRHSR